MGRNESAICDGLKKKRERRPLDPLTTVSFSTRDKDLSKLWKEIFENVKHGVFIIFFDDI